MELPSFITEYKLQNKYPYNYNTDMGLGTIICHMMNTSKYKLQEKVLWSSFS